MPTSDALLTVDHIDVYYGHVSALADVSITVGQREVVTVLGANGAGKSTLLRTISGLTSPRRGAIYFGGQRIDRLSSHRVARSGIAHVPEGRRVVAPLSVEENLLIAAEGSRRRSRSGVAEGLDEVYTVFPRLRDRRRQASGLLSGGEQQMLALGRGIMANPDLLLLDEPSMGLAPVIVDEIYAFLADRTGTLAGRSILIAEQSASLGISIAQRAYVLSRGRLTFAGDANDLDEETMINAYLGARR